MKVLFIHQNMPGQYKHLAPLLASDPNNQVVFLTKEGKQQIPNVKKVEFRVSRDCKQDLHKYLIPVERAILSGQEVWRSCKKMKDAGFVPDVICAHPGWGEGLFLKDIFPDSRLLNFIEFFYRPFGADMYFDPAQKIDPNDTARVRVKSLPHFLYLEYCDWAICPTYWQASTTPKGYHDKISVLHDGVDANACKPDPTLDHLVLPNGLRINRTDEIVTHVARNFEPYRGFPTFMKSVEVIHRERPNAQVIVIGSDGVSYGAAPKSGKTYRQEMLEQVKIDPKRLHFIGTIPHHEMVRVMQMSSAHIYLTVPFVLSWSMMEAMATGCVVVGSKTQPVQEVIQDGVNGLLADFFDPEDVARRVCEVLDHKDRMQHIREAARQTILDKYALDKVLPYHAKLVTELAEGKVPPPVAEEIKAFNTLEDLNILYKPKGRAA